MAQSDPRIERYLAKDRPWRDEMVALRAILLSEGLGETLKWRSPCYTAHGGNVAMIAGLKDAAALSFFKGVLIRDDAGRLELPGPNSRSARFMKFAGMAEIASAEALIRTYIRQAVENERLGRKVDLPKDDFDYPEELVAAMAADPVLAEAFAALTPGRQRGWVLHFAGAKQAATRHSRIAKATPKILAGKGMHDR
ncbi:YdeI family protein [Pseudooceanicola sp.]|uniref:YdeI/OmpD-associated family protein n=1 Tax=Pseudooceanicola sp. TaxID=1914328 RepID=UPI0035128DE6